MKKKGQIRLRGKAYRELQKQVLERDNFTCQVCGCHTEAPCHHVIFRSQGGNDTLDNLITLCGPLQNDCHRAVHDKLININVILKEKKVANG